MCRLYPLYLWGGGDWCNVIVAISDMKFSEIKAECAIGWRDLEGDMWAYTMWVAEVSHALGCMKATFIYFYIFSSYDTLASMMAWSPAWLHLDWCVLMESFLKWCVKTLHHYFSKHVSTKSWPYKSANRMPCIRQCVYILFLVPRKIYSV